MEDMAESQKNVIELMREMLHEQENENNCANNATIHESTNASAKMKNTGNGGVDTSLKIDTRKSEARRPTNDQNSGPTISRLMNTSNYHPTKPVNTGNTGRARSQIVSHSAHALNDFQPNIKVGPLTLSFQLRLTSSNILKLIRSNDLDFKSKTHSA